MSLPSSRYITQAGGRLAPERVRHHARLAARMAYLDTSTLLRAVAILAVLGSRIGLFVPWGGAHVLPAVVGYNFARFAVTSAPAVRRMRTTARTLALIAVPTAVWVLLTLPFSDYYGWQNVLLLNKILYLLHWQVYPLFGEQHVAALVVSPAAGVTAARLVALTRNAAVARSVRSGKPGSSRWMLLRPDRSVVSRPDRSVFHGPDLGRRLVRQFRDQQIARNRLAGKVIE
ncbi:hypothetical protein JK358_05885 [Nocardia sp. 2]|uniref:Uncharacterized protein n=1 Tax=Nocardia acididurans TaxID=2802282 RepID=A0ABS1M072_9NOCA|nr:hypothetical protein [Nocardia acididurans]MBL1073919.1 hypothetical protein [Nocardia acididurans]